MAGGLGLSGTGAVSGLPQPIPAPRFALSHIFRLQNQWVFGEVTLRTGCSQRIYTRATATAALSPARASPCLPRPRRVPLSHQNGRSGWTHLLLGGGGHGGTLQKGKKNNR